MRIGIEAQRIFRQKKHGMDFVALELIRNLPTDQGHEYIVFVNAADEDIQAELFPHVTIVNHKTAYPLWEQFWLPKAAAKQKVDVLHCTANTFPVRSSVPVVLTLHDVIFLESNPLFKGGYTWYQRLGNSYRRLLVKNFIQSVKNLVTVSHFEQRNITEHVKAKTNAEVVYNGVGEHFANGFNDDDFLKSKFNLPDEYFLFLGNTDPKKNTPNTLKAFAQLAAAYPQLYLVIGDLEQVYINQCLPGKQYEYARKRIVPLGYINNQELPGLMRMARAFLYPSLRESFGIPLLEGMASGVPVISSNTSSLPEIAGGAALLVDPTNADELTDAMKQLLENETLRKNLIASGKFRSKAFSWQKMATEYVELYKKVA